MLRYPSPRELQILLLVAEGYTNVQIAERYYITVDTVKTHTRRLCHVFGARNRTGMVVRAFEAGVLRIGPNKKVVAVKPKAAESLNSVPGPAATPPRPMAGVG